MGMGIVPSVHRVSIGMCLLMGLSRYVWREGGGGGGGGGGVYAVCICCVYLMCMYAGNKHMHMQHHYILTNPLTHTHSLPGMQLVGRNPH